MSHSNPQFQLDRLKEIPFSAVVERYDTVHRKGAQYVTCCPWHADHRPSLYLYERTGENHCHCFACGQGGSVIDYVMQHDNLSFQDACMALSRDFGIDLVEGNMRHVPMHRKKPQEVPVKTITYIPLEIVERMQSMESSFCRALCQLFAAERVEWVAEQYRLGVYESWKYADNVVFPSIDRCGRVRNLKTQRYCPDIRSPQFLHADHKHILYLGKMLVEQGLLPKNSEFDNNCLFGEHLLTARPEDMVMLVESPKNAVLGALVAPQYVWVATGSKNALKRTVGVLRGRRVMVYPDRDAISTWKQQLHEMRDIALFEVSDLCERCAPADEAKYDIADYIISNRLKSVMHYSD